MDQQKVELRKIRNFGENINDTFLYIQQNAKPLISSFLIISGVFLLAKAISAGLYDRDMGGILSRIFEDANNSESNYLQLFSGAYFFNVVFSWLSAAAMIVVLTVFVKLYQLKNQEAPTVEEVWLEFKKYFFKVLLYLLPIYVLIFLGFIFCLLPGVYLSVVLMPFPIVIIMEDATFKQAFDRCFALVKNNFWLSIGIYLVAYIIFAVASGVITLVVGGIVGLLTFFSTNSMATTSSIVTSVLNIFTYLFYIVFFVSVILHYYTLTEKLDATGVISRLDTIGRSGSESSTIQEDY